MDNKLSAKVIQEFDEKISLYGEFGERLFHLIKELLIEAGISFHSVTYREKSRESFVKKLRKPGASYENISNVTDLCGLRIITHFNDDVARVSEIIESEFSIDKINSVDKSDILDPDRFGYLSVHYVLSNNATRSGLREYRKFNGLKAEIQIRSILQHAWAEIEHDLGYKSRRGVPREVRRRFSRLAGLLELADQEFSTIRDELGSYSAEVIGRIRAEPSLVELNAPSYQALVCTNSEIQALDTPIAALKSWRLVDPGIEYCARQVERLNYFDIFTIGDLEKNLTKHHNLIKRFSHAWLIINQDEDEDEDEDEEGDDGIINRGICIFYLCYILAILKSEPNSPSEYIRRFNIGSIESSYESTAEELVSVYKDVTEGGL